MLLAAKQETSKIPGECRFITAEVGRINAPIRGRLTGFFYQRQIEGFS